MNIYGNYDNENFAKINVKLEEEKDVASAFLHEIIHLLLSMQTRCGCAEYYLARIARLIDYKYMLMSDCLHQHSIEVQEGLAELWEKLYIYKTSGKEECIIQIKKSRHQNRASYNYLQNILPLLEASSDNDIDDIGFCIYRSAIHSMNMNIEELSQDLWKDNKIINETLKAKNPNSIFKSKLDILIEFIKSNRPLIEFIDELEDEWNCAEYAQKNIYSLTEYVKGICSDSKSSCAIEDYLKTIKPIEIDVEKIYEKVIPASFSHYEYEGGLYYSNNPNLYKYSMVFVYGNIDDCIYTFKNKKMPGYLKDLENNKFPLMFFDYNTKRMVAAYVNITEFTKVLKQFRKPIVVSYKAYENNEKLRDLLNKLKKVYYVYCDRPYYSAKLTINNICINKSFSIINYKAFDVVCIEINSYGKIFVPVMSSASFLEDVKNHFFSGCVNDVSYKMTNTCIMNSIVNCLYEI